MDILLADLGRWLSIRGGHAVLRSMCAKAGATVETETEGKLAKADIAKAENWIRTQGWYADTLVIHPEQEADFQIRNEIWHRSRIPTGYVPEEKRGSN